VRWVELTEWVILLVTSVRTDPNLLPPYIFTNCFLVGVLIVGLVSSELFSGGDQSLLVWWNALLKGSVSC
jgi:hypothetical protein